jgi:hypothetical protein
MASSGSTRKITVNTLLGAGGTATLASATITGNLTVDTNVLFVDAANNVVGINTASPLIGNDAGLTIGAIGTVKALNIGLQNTFARFREKDAVDGFAITTNITGSNTQDDATKSSWKVRMGFANGNDNYVISRSNVGSTTFQDIYSLSTTSAIWSDGAGGTRMTLNSTGLGIGASPGLSGGTRRALTVNAPTGQLSILELAVNSSIAGYLFSNATQTTLAAVGSTFFSVETNAVERHRIDSTGIATWSNVGGVAGTAMTLNATGLGIGIAGGSIAGKLDVDVGAGGFGYFRSSTYSNLQINGRSGGAGSGGCQLFLTTTGSRSWLVGQRTDATYASGSSFFIRDDTASATRLEIDTSGRVLVGSTSAFSDLTGSKEVKIGDGGMQTLTVASLPAATATNIARGGVGGLVYVGGYNGTGQYGAVVLWTAASATVVSVINGTGSTITFDISAGFLRITSSLVLTQVTASCIRI